MDLRAPNARGWCAHARHSAVAALFSCVAVVGPTGVAAQTESDFFSDANVLRLTRLMLTNLPKARCAGQPCAAATEAELQAPPVTIEQARRSMRTGLVSGEAEHCGLDWEGKNFIPMVNDFRRNQKLDDRQMAVLTMLHGAIQGAIFDAAKTSGACTAAAKAAAEKKLGEPR